MRLSVDTHMAEVNSNQPMPRIENTIETNPPLTSPSSPIRNKWMNSSYGKWLSYDLNLNFKSHRQSLPSLPMSQSVHHTSKKSIATPPSPKSTLVISNQKYSYYDFLSYPVCILDDTGTIVYSNRCFRKTISSSTTRFFDLIEKVIYTLNCCFYCWVMYIFIDLPSSSLSGSFGNNEYEEFSS